MQRGLDAEFLDQVGGFADDLAQRHATDQFGQLFGRLRYLMAGRIGIEAATNVADHEAEAAEIRHLMRRIRRSGLLDKKGDLLRHPILTTGMVTLKSVEGRGAVAAPPLQRQTPTPALLAEVLTALGLHADEVLAAQDLNNGPHWLGLLIDSVDSLLALDPDHAALKRLGTKVGVAAKRDNKAGGLIRRANREARAFAPSAHPTNDPTDLEVRAFAAPVGIAEDPVTGSLNASLAQWLMADGHMPSRYSARQGTALGRAGQVFLSQDAQGQVWVGGDVVGCIEGSVNL